MPLRTFCFCMAASVLWAGCAASLRLQAAGTVRGMTDLGAESAVSGKLGRPAGNGLVLAGATASAGIFEGKSAISAAGALEYLHFFSRYAAAVTIHAGPRRVGDDAGFTAIVQGSVMEPFPRAAPAGYLGATLWAGWGWGEDAIRGGFLGVGLFWEFCDLFFWR